MTGINDDSSPPSSGKPVILPLLRKLYLKEDDSCKVGNNGTSMQMIVVMEIVMVQEISLWEF